MEPTVPRPGLTGFHVLDLSRLLPGAFATLQLADLGADVIKVESPGNGDYGRLIDPETFAALNRNKRSIVLDLRTDRGRESLLRLVARSDAVVESHRPGVLEKMGLGYERLREANRRVVLCSVTGFGQTGPYSSRPGHDLNFLALSGFFAVPHRTGDRVDRVGVRVADMAGSMYAALATVTAVYGARATGEGCHLDVSLHEAAAAWTGPFMLPPRDGPYLTANPLVTGDNDIFATADGRRLALATFEDKFWLSFRQRFAADFPVLADGSYDHRADRTRAGDEVRSMLAKVFAQRDLEWWSEALTGLDVPWAPVYESSGEFLADPHVRARGLVTARKDQDSWKTDGGTTRNAHGQVRFPVLFGTEPVPVRLPAPAHGEHTDEVLTGIDDPRNENVLQP